MRHFSLFTRPIAVCFLAGLVAASLGCATKPQRHSDAANTKSGNRAQPTMADSGSGSLDPTPSPAPAFSLTKVTYKTIGDSALQLHIFNPLDHDRSDQRPAIVFFFGGGWKGGAPTQFYPHCEYLAARGMVAISVEYRTETSHGTSPQECVKDGKSAMRWVRAHAAELGIDPHRIAAGGGSAGAHVAAATATLTGYNEASDDLAVDCRPNALVLFNPVFDNGPDGYGYDRVAPYWESFSPMHNLTAKTPPTVVFLGTNDALIPVATAEEYQRRMQALGGRCDLHLYEGQTHGFFNARNVENYTATLRAADEFLNSLGYLQGKPTL